MVSYIFMYWLHRIWGYNNINKYYKTISSVNKDNDLFNIMLYDVMFVEYDTSRATSVCNYSLKK